MSIKPHEFDIPRATSHYQRVRQRRAKRLHGYAAIVTACTVSCGALNCSNKPAPQPADPPTAPEPQGKQAEATANSPSTGEGSTATTAGADEGPQGPVRLTRAALPTIAPLPRFSAEVLQSRVEAQASILGQDKLLEDASGGFLASIAPTSLAELGIELPSESGDDNEDDADASDAAETAENSGDKAEESVDLDELDQLPGSAGVSAQFAQIERIDGNSLGIYVPMTMASGHELDHFYRALSDLAQAKSRDAKQPEKVRILVYGASHTQADVYTEYLRRHFQKLFGNGGQGYIAAGRANRWYRHMHFTCEASRGWKVDRAQKRDARSDGLFGLLGASFSSRSKRDNAKIVPRDSKNPFAANSSYELQYLKQPKGGKFTVRVDGKTIATLDSRSRKNELGLYRFSHELGQPVIELSPTGQGEARIFGVIAERDEPGVVVDTLGISGTRASNQLNWDEKLWTDSVRSRDPDLYMLAFGTNEATDTNQSASAYEDQLKQVLARFRRAVPEASCVLIGPGDFASKIDEDTWVQNSRLSEIVQVQQKVAAQAGCAFWDGLAFMGGTGTMPLWVNSYPPMASRDHIHLTRRGYVRMGMAIGDALLANFGR